MGVGGSVSKIGQIAPKMLKPIAKLAFGWQKNNQSLKTDNL